MEHGCGYGDGQYEYICTYVRIYAEEESSKQWQ